jgi:endoglucanase
MPRYFIQIIMFVYAIAPSSILFAQSVNTGTVLSINNEGYYEAIGINVMMYDDFYPEGHQGGLTIVLNDRRVAASGDVRLEPTPGQWSPVPAVGERYIDKENGIISVELWYPDSTKDRTGFNPIIYPDLHFKYSVRTEVVGDGIRVIVDLHQPLPDEWADKVGFNLELFPGYYFGEHYFIDGEHGIFPQQAHGPMYTDSDGELRITPLATGRELIVAPGKKGKEIRFTAHTSDLQLIDGRGLHNNGWYVIRSTIPRGAEKNAVEWFIRPSTDSGWIYRPVIQVSQVGYHPAQVKFAVIEMDKRTDIFEPVRLVRIDGNTETVVKTELRPVPWGRFLRFMYVRFDFTDVTRAGLYKIRYGDNESHTFEIKENIFSRNVWHPTLEYFLPVQMCHMRVEDRYKVWHGLCHMDDALMAPVNHNHFDGYIQGESTLTDFRSGEHVPGINIGGWHDAGDYDIRLESQAETVYKLALAYEYFKDDYDATTVDRDRRTVNLLTPDGKPDILQQLEHGVLSIVGGYESMGRLYRGIISPTLKQYVHLGDAATMSDNLIYSENKNDPILDRTLPMDDRWVFTEINPGRELYAAQCLAGAGRVLRQFNPGLSEQCVRIAEEIYENNVAGNIEHRLNTAAELYLATRNAQYGNLLLEHADVITGNIFSYSEVIGRVVKELNNTEFTATIEDAVGHAYAQVTEQQKENPYGVPDRPHIWGAGWGIQAFGVKQLFLHLGFPEIYPSDYAFNALNFVLGVHPGENTASFVSGVGVHSLLVAYGTNRDEWSYIPGGIASGTALIRPDLPELKTWPYFWQQSEYVMGGGTMDFLLLAIAAQYIFADKN